jgi:hypothetical protein
MSKVQEQQKASGKVDGRWKSHDGKKKRACRGSRREKPEAEVREKARGRDIQRRVFMWCGIHTTRASTHYRSLAKMLISTVLRKDSRSNDPLHSHAVMDVA